VLQLSVPFLGLVFFLLLLATEVVQRHIFQVVPVTIALLITASAFSFHQTQTVEKKKDKNNNVKQANQITTVSVSDTKQRKQQQRV
jgi:hypothetical protein